MTWLIFLIIGLGVSQSSAQELLKVHFVDVGYGDAILIEPKSAPAILLDAGPSSSSKRLLKFIKEQGISQIEIGILSHPHENHFGGFIEVLSNYRLKKFYFNGDSRQEEGFSALAKMLEKQMITLQVISKNEILDTGLQDLKLEILHPKKNLEGGVNETALVILLKFKEISFLFLSDVGLREQTQVLYELNDSASIDVVQLPHHGDLLSDKLVEDLASKIFIVSTGENIWGLPKEAELKKLKGKVYRTDKLGHISFWTDGKVLKLLDNG